MTKDAVRAPNCPKCGSFMDKVEVLVTEQLAKGTVEVSHAIDDAYVGWVCPNPKCHEVKSDESEKGGSHDSG